MGIENRKHRQHHSTLTLARGLALLCAGAMFAACGNSGTSVSTPTPAHTTSPSASSTPEPPTTPPPAVPQAAASLAAGTTSSLSFAACGSASWPSGEPPAADNGAKGACEAAKELYPSSGITCAPPQGQTYQSSPNCPLTSSLAQRLDSHPLPGADAICRCQNTYQSASYQVAGPIPGLSNEYVVRAKLQFGQLSQSFDVIVSETSSGSLIGDIQCGGGGSATSIMQQPTSANHYLQCG